MATAQLAPSKSSSASTYENATHITAAEAGRRYPFMTRNKLYRLVVLGLVSRVLPPGKTPRYSVADIERALAEGV